MDVLLENIEQHNQKITRVINQNFISMITQMILMSC